jgi:hypothetical protein
MESVGMTSPGNSHLKTVLILTGAAGVVAVLRYFMKGWVDPLGVPAFLGSLLASITLVLLIGLVLLFVREGRESEGRYFVVAGWFVALAVWCELLVITGILVTERTGAETYYQGPWEAVRERFTTPSAHAIGHSQGFFVRTAIALLLGAVIYWLAKRRRTSQTQPA